MKIFLFFFICVNCVAAAALVTVLLRLVGSVCLIGVRCKLNCRPNDECKHCDLMSREN